MSVTCHGLRLGILSLSPGALFGAALLFYSGLSPVQAACLTAAALHEGGHLLACFGLGIEVRRLRLTLLGAVLDTDSRCGSGWEEVLVALAGPLLNLCTVPLALSEHRRLLAGASLLLGAFNLLPMAPLDGSRILHGLLSAGGDLNRAEEVLQTLTQWCEWVLLGAGLALGAMGNRSLLLLALWLMLGGQNRNKTRKEGAFWRQFSGGLCQ